MFPESELAEDKIEKRKKKPEAEATGSLLYPPRGARPESDGRPGGGYVGTLHGQRSNDPAHDDKRPHTQVLLALYTHLPRPWLTSNRVRRPSTRVNSAPDPLLL